MIGKLKLILKGSGQEFRELLCKTLGCGKHKTGRVWIFHEGTEDKPIKPQENIMDVTLSKPIAPGFYRECQIGTDEAVDKREDGKFAIGGVESGDSSAPQVSDESTEKLIKFNVMGDGSLGDKVATLTVDGHVGDGDVPLTLRILYKVAHKDATEFVGFAEGEDKPIAV
jgi:hypothetical protein